jgi:hypothetical protein
MTEQATVEPAKVEFDPKPVSEERLKLLKAMFEARKEMKTVAMSGVNKFDNYEYSTNADFVTCIEVPCEKHGLLITHEVVEDAALEPRKNHKGNVEQVRKVTIRTTCTLVDNGQSISTEFACEGMDPRDKANLKANTGAKKYALANLFNLKTGIDPESNEDGRNSAGPPQRTSQAGNQQRQQQSSGQSPGRQPRQPRQTTAPATITAPKAWPDTDVTNLCNWLRHLPRTASAFKVAWGMIVGNNDLHKSSDWFPVLKEYTGLLRINLHEQTFSKEDLGEKTIAEVAKEVESANAEQAFKDEPAPQDDNQDATGTESTHGQETAG